MAVSTVEANPDVIVSGESTDEDVESPAGDPTNKLLQGASGGPAYGGIQWDPMRSRDWEKEQPSTQCLLRVKR